VAIRYPKFALLLLFAVSLRCGTGNADVVELVTGQRIKGHIESVAESKLTIKTVDGESQEIPFVDTVEIEFGEIAKPPVVPPSNEVQPGLQPQLFNGAQPPPTRVDLELIEVPEKFPEGETPTEPARSLPPDPFGEPTAEEYQEIGPVLQKGDGGGTPPKLDAVELGSIPQYIETDETVVGQVELDIQPGPNVPKTSPGKKSGSKNVRGKNVRGKNVRGKKKSQSPIAAKPTIPKEWRVVTYAGGAVAGQLKSFDADSVAVTLTNQALKEVSIPRIYVRRMTFIPDEHLVANAPENASSDDVVIAKVANNRTTKVVGKVLGIEDGSVKFSYQGQVKTIALDKIVRIDLGMAAEDAGTLNTTNWSVYQHAVISKSISFPVRLVSVDEEFVSLKSIWGADVKLPRKHHLRLETRNGRIEYLSALPVADVAQAAYFGRIIPWQKDTTLAGHAIELDGRSYRHGISVHSRTELTFQLDGRFDQFQTYVGFDRLASPQGNVSLQVVVDENVVYEDESYQFSDEVEKLDLSVVGGKSLKLIVGFGEGQDVGDRIIWADARLVRTNAK
jgi:ribosome maturation factor RimP